jgi:hypothetical protein
LGKGRSGESRCYKRHQQFVHVHVNYPISSSDYSADQPPFQDASIMLPVSGHWARISILYVLGFIYVSSKNRLNGRKCKRQFVPHCTFAAGRPWSRQGNA